MNYLETIFNFLLRLAGIVLGRRKRKQPAESDNNDQPGTDRDPRPGDEATGGGADSDRGNPDAVGNEKRKKSAPGQAVNILGWCLMLGGSLACFLRD